MQKSATYQLLGLNREVLSAVRDFDWYVKTLALHEHLGRKTSRRLGSGLEFSQYRPYSQGDDLRQLDWKMYARTDRFFIKQSEIDTNISVTFVIDQSASMKYEEDGLQKSNYAKLLCAVLAFHSAERGDKYGIAGVSDADHGMAPRHGKKHWDRFLHHLLHLEAHKKFTQPYIPRIQEKELFVVISDLYEEQEEWNRFIKNLKTRRNEVIVFHLMGEKEMTLNFAKTLHFDDLETGQRIKTDPGAWAEDYQAAINEWISTLSQGFLSEGIDYQLVNMKDPMEQVISRFVWRRKQLA